MTWFFYLTVGFFVLLVYELMSRYLLAWAMVNKNKKLTLVLTSLYFLAASFGLGYLIVR